MSAKMACNGTRGIFRGSVGRKRMGFLVLMFLGLFPMVVFLVQQQWTLVRDKALLKTLECYRLQSGAKNNNCSALTDTKSWKRNETVIKDMQEKVKRFFDPTGNISLLKYQVKPGDRMWFLQSRIFSHSSVTVSQSFHNMLPSRPPLENKHFRKCAVVGNSGILLHSGCGREIDTHDFVFRCNLPELEGHERDVGTKSNFTTMNPSVILTYYKDFVEPKLKERFINRLRRLEGGILFIPAFVATWENEHVQWTNDIIVEHNINVRTAYPSPDMEKWITGYWKSTKYRVARPSSGLWMYTFAVSLCDEVHLYGMYPFDIDRYGRNVNYHYYDPRPFATTHFGHDMPIEFQVFKSLHEKGALRLQTDKCQSSG
ncbi:alpha-2,8-sialyltransferase 8B-like [Branchiostoma floridae x Branchiostoma japonicum]